MFYAIVFVVGLVIATIINRRFPRTVVQTVIEQQIDNNGEYITNEQFMLLINDLVLRIPECNPFISEDNALFVNRTTGKVERLSLTDGWIDITSAYRKAGRKALAQQQFYQQEAPPEWAT